MRAERFWGGVVVVWGDAVGGVVMGVRRVTGGIVGVEGVREDDDGDGNDDCALEGLVEGDMDGRSDSDGILDGDSEGILDGDSDGILEEDSDGIFELPDGFWEVLVLAPTTWSMTKRSRALNQLGLFRMRRWME